MRTIVIGAMAGPVMKVIERCCVRTISVGSGHVFGAIEGCYVHTIGEGTLKGAVYILKCMLVEFCRSVTPSPHVRVKGHLGDDSQLLLYYCILGNVFLLKGGSSHQLSAKA